MKPAALLCALLPLLPPAAGAVQAAPAADVPCIPSREMAETEPVLMSAPNARGERGAVLKSAPYSGLGKIIGLRRADGTLLPARGGLNKYVSLGFDPSFVCWVGERCLLAFTPSAPAMPPHAARREGGLYQPCLRSQLCIVELHGDRAAPSRGEPGVRCEEHTRLDLPAGLKPSLKDGTLRLLGADGRPVLVLDVAALPTADSPRRPLLHPACRAGVEEAAEAMAESGFTTAEDMGFGLEVAGVSPANGRGERIVSLMPGDERFRKGNYPLALLTREGELHPLGGEGLAARAESMLPPNGFQWLDEDSFLLRASGRTYELVEVWKLAPGRRPRKQAGDPMPRIGIERLLKGQFGRGRELEVRPGRLRVLLGEEGRPVGEVSW